MIFTPADRRLIQEIKADIAAIDDKLDIHAQLVELCAEVKALREAHGGALEAEAKAVAAELGKSTDSQAAAIAAMQPAKQ